MRSSVSGWRALAIAAVCFGMLGVCTLAPSSAIASPDEEEVNAALEQVQADPNLSPHRTIRTLRWAGERQQPDRSTPGWLEWVGGFFKWLASLGRVFFWAVILLVLGLLGLLLFRLVQNLRPAARIPAAADAPTHVRELDIRPESLPRDIGAAALQLWERNDHRGALVLLYRGLLSRLVHGHGVPIRESSTEAECLNLAIPHLGESAARYTAGLVRVWQHAIYGARDPASEDMRTLCTGFDGIFPAPADSEAEQA